MSIKQEELGLTRERVLRIHNRIVETMAEHEKTCGICSYWVENDGTQRCDEYRRMARTRSKWGKKYDDWGLYGENN